jgi:hypothetical protein
MNYLKKTFLLVILGLSILEPNTYADDRSRPSLRIDNNTRLSYGSGCIVGNCSTGIGYYIYENGKVAIGKWAASTKYGAALNGVGIDSTNTYYTAANYSDWTPTFGLTMDYKTHTKAIGPFALADDGYYNINGYATMTDEKNIAYGIYKYGIISSYGCKNLRHEYISTENALLEKLRTSSSCAEGLCTNGIGKKVYEDYYYIGDFVDGKANGFGILVYNNGNYTAGKFIDNKIGEAYRYIASKNKHTATILHDNKYYYMSSLSNELLVYTSDSKLLGEYCKLTSTASSTPEDIYRQQIANKKFDVQGSFLHYGEGAFDWLYVGQNGSYVAKLKGANKDGFFDWIFLHTANKPGFESVRISSDGKNISFGSAK